MDLLGLYTSETNMETCHSNPNIHWPPNQLTSPYQVPLICIPHLSTTPDLLELTAQIVIILAMYTLYTSEYKLTKQYQTQQLNDKIN